MKSISVSNEFEIIKQVSIQSQNKTNGCDDRFGFIEIEEDSISILSKIKQNKERYTQLQYLLNPHISVIEKLILMEAMKTDDLYAINTYNLQNGGFWKDWE